MSGLELVALVPFGVAVWKLFEKLSDQQSLIAQHEVTINSQKKMLESIADSSGDKKLTLRRTVAIAAAVGLLASIVYKTVGQERPKTRPPPQGYEPTVAEFDAVACTICLENSKDTVFFPCRHFCACWNCAVRLTGGKCPACRGDIESMQFVYQQ